MARPSSAIEVEIIVDPARAAALLKPPRLAILRLAREPVSAAELGSRLGIPRQRANYHVRELARTGFLRRAGRRPKRNMVEQQYVAAARAWLFSPELLGAVAADWRRIDDTASAEFLCALAAQMQSDLARAMRSIPGDGRVPATASLKSQFRFQSPARRDEFEKALRQAVVEVISRYTAPGLRPDGSPGPGQAFRLVLGCYPYHPERSA